MTFNPTHIPDKEYNPTPAEMAAVNKVCRKLKVSELNEVGVARIKEAIHDATDINKNLTTLDFNYIAYEVLTYLEDDRAVNYGE